MGLTIYGSSDDLVELEGEVREEINADHAEIRIGTDLCGLVVTADYAPRKAGGAVWRLAVEQVDEDVPLPWPVRVEPRHAYSPQVVIDCPPGTTVTWTPMESDS